MKLTDNAARHGRDCCWVVHRSSSWQRPAPRGDVDHHPARSVLSRPISTGLLFAGTMFNRAVTLDIGV